MSLLSEIYQLCLSSPVICGCFLCLFCSLLLNLDSIHSSFSSMWDFVLEENSGWVNFSLCLDALTPSIHTRESLDSSPRFICCFQIGLLGFPVSSCITSYSSDSLASHSPIHSSADTVYISYLELDCSPRRLCCSVGYTVTWF